MIRNRYVGAGLTALLVALLVGCQPPKIDLSEMMKPPPRPAELDQLEMLVGRWEGRAEMKVVGSDEVLTSTGVEEIGWEADSRLLVSRYEYTTAEEGRMTGLDVWTWDPKAKKYRYWGFDNHGYYGIGTATYDEDTRTWHFKGKSYEPATGEKYVGEGTSKMVDDDTQDWEFSIWDGWKLQKFMEFKGTSRRR